MSDSARNAIFKAIEESTPEPPASDAEILQQAQALLADPDSVRPSRSTDDVVDAFMNRVNGPKVAAKCTRIRNLKDLPDCVASILSQRSTNLAITLQPDQQLSALNWAEAGINMDSDLDDGVAVTMALWGVAETGSVVVHSGEHSPILMHFLPAVSIVAVPASHLLWHLEDYAFAARQTDNKIPRNACLITGASGTTDIEGSLVTGAHGPGELHIVVVDSAS